MATRHVLLLAVGFAFSSPALVPTAARAEEDASGLREVPEVANANFEFKGRVTSTTYVRSGPSNNFYPTMKLDKGAEVTVVAARYDWLKIVPPEGSFSYVPKAYVHERGDGTVGRVTNQLNVRAGSLENSMKTTVQTKLEAGQDVRILGVQDEYYRVEPPDGAYLYIHQQYVEPVGRGKPAGAAGKQQDAPKEAEQAPAEIAAGTGEPLAGDEADAEGTPDAEGAAEAVEAAPAAPETQPATPTPGIANAAPGGRPATSRPAPAAVAEEFRQLEAEFDTASKLPVVEQPLEQLTEGYAKLVSAGTLGGSMKRIADARLRALQMRADAREQLREFRKSQQELLDRQKELKAEEQELAAQVANTQVTLYAAVGTLRVSSLQQGEATLYRLTDPGTSRTIVYIRSNDPKYATLLNQFVGVKGDVTTDARLKTRIITPTDAEVVDPAKVNGTVVATIVPPSMVTATTATDQGSAGVAE